MTLIPCLCLVPQNNEKLQESPCIFALTPRQVELIRNSRCSGPHPLLTSMARWWVGVVSGGLGEPSARSDAEPAFSPPFQSGSVCTISSPKEWASVSL